MQPGSAGRKGGAAAAVVVRAVWTERQLAVTRAAAAAVYTIVCLCLSVTVSVWVVALKG